MGLLLSVSFVSSFIPLPIGMLLDVLAWSAFTFRDFANWMLVTLPLQVEQWFYSVSNPVPAVPVALLSQYRPELIIGGSAFVIVVLVSARKQQKEIERYIPLRKALYAR